MSETTSEIWNAKPILKLHTQMFLHNLSKEHKIKLLRNMLDSAVLHGL